MNMRDIVILGCGGCGRELLWLLEDNNEALPSDEKWNIVGFVEPKPEQGQMVSGYPVVSDDWLIHQKNLAVACGLGEPLLRERVITKLKNANPALSFPTLISRRAHCSSRVEMGEGCIVCAGSVLTCDIKLGDFVTINTGSVVTHDCKLDDFVQINPSTNLSGGVHVGRCTQIGTGVKVIPKIEIGDHVILGAGTVVIRDIPPNCTAVGCPAQVIKCSSEQ